MFGKTEELVIVLVIVLVLFGGKKLPELARSIGLSVREVRKGFRGEDSEIKEADKTA
jgi:sec-independent protein translocase protein TatA